MPVHEDLAVRYHQQDDRFLCGAACAQVVLAYIGAGLLDQADLDSDIYNHNLIETGWAAAPDGLHWTMNDGRPTSFPGSFARFELNSQDAIARTIVWSIHQGKVPAIALISGRSHWIVVRGFEASALPAGPDDPTYSIISLDINNPSPPVSASPPPPHALADECGSGGDHGFADEHIAYGHWLSAYMTGVPVGSYWGGKFVAVAKADAAPTRLGSSAPAPRKLSGERVMPADKAREQAVAGLQEYGLYERATWGKSLSKTSPGNPILVQRLDRRDTFYYIVPMQVSRKIVRVLVCVDARFGNYQQAARISEHGNAFRGFNYDPKGAVHKVVGKTLNFGRRGRLTIRKEAFCLYPTLVWRPSRESMSPYVPFFMVTVGNRRVYVRVDGQVFASLHVNDAGI